MPRFDVCSLGTVCWDLIATIEQFPAPDEKVPMGDVTQLGGGQAGTAAAVCAALGADTAVFGRTGDDEFGQNIHEEFHDQQVDTCGLQTVPGETSQFAICLAHEATNTRTIFYRYGSFERMKPDDVDLDLVTDCKCLLVDCHHIEASIGAARRARARSVPVVLDAERPQEGLMELIDLTHYVIIPAELCSSLGEGDEQSGRERILNTGAEVLVLTRGEQGADAYTGEQTFHQPAFEVPEIVDTTGAGDVFHGAFGRGLSLGYDIQENVRFASATAALSTTAAGGRGHLPSITEVCALLKRPT